jgi:hypothetical protein
MPEGETMQYMILIYENEAAYGDHADSPEMKEMIAQHYALAGELGDKLKAGAGLQPVATATTVRTEGGAKTVHDGPFAETREQLGGYYLIDVADLEAAKAWAARIPIIPGGKVEVRPVVDHSGEGA